MEDFLDLVNQVWTSGFLGISMSEVLISLFILIVSLIFRGVFANVGVNSLKKLTSSKILSTKAKEKKIKNVFNNVVKKIFPKYI